MHRIRKWSREYSKELAARRLYRLSISLLYARPHWLLITLTPGSVWLMPRLYKSSKTLPKKMSCGFSLLLLRSRSSSRKKNRKPESRDPSTSWKSLKFFQIFLPWKRIKSRFLSLGFNNFFFSENSAWNWSATRWERHATPDMISNIYTIDLVIGLNSLLFYLYIFDNLLSSFRGISPEDKRKKRSFNSKSRGIVDCSQIMWLHFVGGSDPGTDQGQNR